ncbi:C40 family peptidase, partial [Streptomyces sp. NPDC049577]|uniref:C40 family peptidase n=1 Tax=Streptomyces sp. NPDC049577 TaxID=3155153 RepID=UPI0034283B02
ASGRAVRAPGAVSAGSAPAADAGSAARVRRAGGIAPGGVATGDATASQGRRRVRAAPGPEVASAGSAARVRRAGAVTEVASAPQGRRKAKAARGVEGAVSYALRQIGDPYVLGGNGPKRWDCSGLVQQAYKRAGIRLPRLAVDQYRATARVSKKSLRRGDLVFWSANGRASGVHHVAIYLGGGRYVESARPGTKVRISSFSYFSPNMYGRPVAKAEKAGKAKAAAKAKQAGKAGAAGKR